MFDQYYEIFKVIHVIAVISWMAGMLYLPRIFCYHCEVAVGSESDLIFQKMERRLLRIIMNPAMIITFLFGFLMAHIYGFEALGGWFHIKLTAVLVLAIIHGFFAKIRKDFEKGKNKNSVIFYKIINEIPTLMMVIAVFMVILKPFD